MMASVENPFRYAGIATGRYFTDRAAELAELRADIRSAQNVVIISPRRYGKSSLVFRAIEQLRQDRVLIAYIDIFGTPTKDRFADHLAEAVYSGLVAPVERLWQRAVDAFQKLPIRPKITINQAGTPSFEFTADVSSRDLDRTIEALLKLPGEIAQSRKRRVAIILDEFQEILTINPHLPAIMRSIFQFQGEVSHVFLGSKRHLMHQVFDDVNQPLYKSAKPLILGPIRSEDFGPFIREQFARTRLEITPEATDRILTITGGHPHDTQKLCYFTWGLTQGAEAAATTELVERALGHVIEAEDARYTALWESLSPQQRLVLVALSSGTGPVFSEAYRRRHRLGSASRTQKALDRLVEREIVEFSVPSTYSVPDVFLRMWVSRITEPTTPDHPREQP